jgi:hypothetical protein
LSRSEHSETKKDVLNRLQANRPKVFHSESLGRTSRSMLLLSVPTHSDRVIGQYAVARLAGPGGARSVVAESVLVKLQLLILNRPQVATL